MFIESPEGDRVVVRDNCIHAVLPFSEKFLSRQKKYMLEYARTHEGSCDHHDEGSEECEITQFLNWMEKINSIIIIGDLHNTTTDNVMCANTTDQFHIWNKVYTANLCLHDFEDGVKGINNGKDVLVDRRSVYYLHEKTQDNGDKVVEVALVDGTVFEVLENLEMCEDILL